MPIRFPAAWLCVLMLCPIALIAAPTEENDEPKPTPASAALMTKAGTLISKGDEAGAVKLLTDALEKNPDDAYIRGALVRFIAQRGKADDALKLIREARELPSGGKSPFWPSEEAIILLVAKNDTDGAVKLMREAITLAPRSEHYKEQLLQMLTTAGQNERAIKEADAMIKAGDDVWWVHYRKGIALCGIKEFDKAATLAAFDQALKKSDKELAGVQQQIIGAIAGGVDPQSALDRIGPFLKRDDPDFSWRLSHLYLLQATKDHEKSKALSEALLKESTGAAKPVRATVLRGTAAALHDRPTPDIAKIRAIYEELITADPQDVMALNNLAYMLIDEVKPHEPQKAREYASRAIQIMQSRKMRLSTTVMDTLGWALVQCGGPDLPTGVDLLEKLVKAEPESPDSRYHLGEAYARQGRRDDAIKQLEAATELIQKRQDKGDKRRTDDLLLKDIAGSIDRLEKQPATK